MKPYKTRLAAFLLASLWVTTAWSYDPANREEYQAKIKEAKRVFDDRCKNVAGVKIYKTVPDVEGVLLLKVRPAVTDRELSDQMWPGAAFGGEYSGDSYLRSFLGYEHPGTITKTRGYINTDQRPGSLPGYRWVEVIDPEDGQRYRYSAHYDEPWQTDKSYLKGYIRFNLDKTPSPSKTPPRYAVTFDDHVIPEERALWLASSTIKVLDLEKNEVLAEWTRYAMSYIHRPGGGVPWLNQSICPYVPGGAQTNTRQFADQVLMPKKEK